jgi:hypothetical protein
MQVTRMKVWITEGILTLSVTVRWWIDVLQYIGLSFKFAKAEFFELSIF